MKNSMYISICEECSKTIQYDTTLLIGKLTNFKCEKCGKTINVINNEKYVTVYRYNIEKDLK